ncbi:MAG: type 1 glutamine amidotransferase [Rhodobacteraceae bacterium]|nr:type 1 glutamine amidotransferase [Paracoccaceae bacterium]
MKIGILQTGHAPDGLRETFGDYDDLFRVLLNGHGFSFDTYNVVDNRFPDGPGMADGWLITGSPHGAYEDLPWIPKLEDLIRASRAAERPLIGVCFGHQIIAQALGGTVEQFKDGWAVGRTEYNMGGVTVPLFAWHQDQVVVPPPDARVLARHPFCENAALAYGDMIWTIQPHPEFHWRFVDGLIKTRGKGVVPDDQLIAAAATLDQPVAQSDIAREMARFFLMGRGYE